MHFLYIGKVIREDIDGLNHLCAAYCQIWDMWCFYWVCKVIWPSPKKRFFCKVNKLLRQALAQLPSLPHPSCRLKFTASSFFPLLLYRKICHQLHDSPEEIYYSLEESAAIFPTGNNLTVQLLNWLKKSKFFTINSLSSCSLCYLLMPPYTSSFLQSKTDFFFFFNRDCKLTKNKRS